jgi:hypothetical protein
MVGWAGATNIQITYLPNKATDKGVCLKTLCNARTRVMINLEFVEGKGEQKKMRYTDEGRAAAVCLRLTEPWHNQVPRMLIADAWFGGAPTAVQLIHRVWYCITNVKTHTNQFCKKELWKDALGNKRNHECNDRAYRELILTITGKNTTLHGAFHMEKAG